MRTFVALELSSGTGEGGAAPSPEHLTLEFLGDVPPESVPRIVERLRPVARAIAPFGIRLEGVGAFPKATDPRVVWVGVTEGRAELTGLARSIQVVLQDTVPGRRDAFVPHLTLFRVRSSSDRRRAFELLEGHRPPPPPRDVPVREFALKESVLGPRGAVHRTIETFPLTGSAGG